jgi:hypothetical protein
LVVVVTEAAEEMAAAGWVMAAAREGAPVVVTEAAEEMAAAGWVMAATYRVQLVSQSRKRSWSSAVSMVCAAPSAP